MQTIHRRLDKKETGDFTQTCNKLSRDKNLSWEARGMMQYLLSQYDNWKIKIKDLTNQTKAQDSKNYKILKELIEAGYILKLAERIKGRIAEVHYFIYEQPVSEIQQIEILEQVKKTYNNTFMFFNNTKKQTRQAEPAQPRKKTIAVPLEKKEKKKPVEPSKEIVFNDKENSIILEIKKVAPKFTAFETIFSSDKVTLQDINKQIEWLPYRKPTNPEKMLYKAIMNKWSAPGELKSSEALQAKKEANKKWTELVNIFDSSEKNINEKAARIQISIKIMSLYKDAQNGFDNSKEVLKEKLKRIKELAELPEVLNFLPERINTIVTFAGV